MLHDWIPVKIDRAFRKRNINRASVIVRKASCNQAMNLLKPVFHIIQQLCGDGVDVQGRFGKVFEDKDHIELLEPKLNTLQGCNLNFAQSDNKERCIREIHQAFRRRL